MAAADVGWVEPALALAAGDASAWQLAVYQSKLRDPTVHSKGGDSSEVIKGGATHSWGQRGLISAHLHCASVLTHTEENATGCGEE